VNASPEKRPGARPSLKTVAKRAGVSVATASYSLQNHPKIPEATRRRVQDAAGELGYRTNATVSRLMAELRSDRGDGSTLAWINCSPARDTYTAVPWMRGWLRGVRARAESLGYGLEEFWLREEGISAERLLKILTARGTAGLLIAPTRTTGGIVPMDVQTFPVVSMAGSFSQPVVHQAITNNFANVLLALDEMSRLGYRKIGFFSHLLSREWAIRQFAGAFLEWQEKLPEKMRSAPLLHDEDAPDAEATFSKWVKKHRFDAILTTSGRSARWLEKIGLRIPEDIGLAHLNLAEDVPGWAGIAPLIEEVAAAAVDLLVGLIHRHETGSPPVQKITTIRGVWVPGRTLRHSSR